MVGLTGQPIEWCRLPLSVALRLQQPRQQRLQPNRIEHDHQGSSGV